MLGRDMSDFRERIGALESESKKINLGNADISDFRERIETLEGENKKNNLGKKTVSEHMFSS